MLLKHAKSDRQFLKNIVGTDMLIRFQWLMQTIENKLFIG